MAGLVLAYRHCRGLHGGYPLAGHRAGAGAGMIGLWREWAAYMVLVTVAMLLGALFGKLAGMGGHP